MVTLAVTSRRSLRRQIAIFSERDAEGNAALSRVP
jgi:hypothetical protein